MNLKQTYLFITNFLMGNALTIINFEEEYPDKGPCVCMPFWRCKDEEFNGQFYRKTQTIDIRKIWKARRLNENSVTTDGQCTGFYDVCCPVGCGRNYLGSNETDYHKQILDPRIHNGNDADFAEFPWMLAVLQDTVYKCGASLIHPQVALTAAHCVKVFNKYKVRAGEWNWTHQKEAIVHQERMTKKVIIHPNYNPQSLTNDLALLILESRFSLTRNVGTICLTPSPYSKTTQKCTVSGWGRNSSKKETYQSTLKKVDIPLVPRDQCLQKLKYAAMGSQFYLHRSFLCAGDGSKDACKGDGGSPLFCEVEGEQGRYEQVGIVSWGLKCGVYKTPGVYVNVGLFIKWIDAEMVKHRFDKNTYKY